jgi:hypothetical protein
MTTEVLGQTLDTTLAETALMPIDTIPEIGTFWSWQLINQPPLPFNPFPEAPVYVIDDRSVDYDAWHKEQLALRMLEAAALGMSLEELNGGIQSAVAASYADGTKPYLLNLTATQEAAQTRTASFEIAGGTNNVPYDILRTTNLLDAVSSWTWVGIGYTSNRFTFTNQPADMAFYALATPERTMTVGWGDNVVDQCEVPEGLTNTVAIAGGAGHSLALLSDGTVVAWGWDAYGQGSVPTNLGGVSMVAAGWYHNVAS